MRPRRVPADLALVRDLLPGIVASTCIIVGAGRRVRALHTRTLPEGLQLWRVELGWPYARAMRSELGAAVDRRLAGLIIARLRRSWPLLKLVPAS